MRVLLVSTNTLPAAPTGPVYLAGAARQKGHEVGIFDRLVAKNYEDELVTMLQEFQPEVVAISIRLVFGDELDANAYLGTRHTDLKPKVKEITDLVRQQGKARIVIGGPGFNYYARNWLDYLDLDYGIRGEGEESFPQYLKMLEEGGDIYAVPGCAYRKGGDYHTLPAHPVQDLDKQALPAYDLIDWQPYAEKKITPAIMTKRGCAFFCTYCPYSKLEGKQYRLKSPQRIIAEARHIVNHTHTGKVMFCENNFNAPRQHAKAICEAFIANQVDFQWGTGDLRPVGITNEFCQLMGDSGCFTLNLSVETASERMLKSMKRGYSVRSVRDSLEALSRSRIPFGASLMIGAPGETPDTIEETLKVMSDYEIPNGVWVTIGIYLWTDYQEMVPQAKADGYYENDDELFRGVVYYSTGLPKTYLLELPEMLRTEKGYSVQFNKPSEEWSL
jgi:radical SAM superfamily enzyme YgiQ (UPF0313 family)